MSISNFEHDTKAVNILKGLIIDTVEKANSGHPGGAMSSADFAYILFKEFLSFDPKNPNWWNRDRFVLSAGHESALLYSLLTLIDFLNIDDLKTFRQWESRTPGHPEHGVTPGVEATTGPLGQGFSMACGMAVAERMLRERTGEDITNHYIYTLVSDGDLQEPISLGSAELAAQWGLGKLITFYDSNKIQLSGPTILSDKTNHKELFESFGWHVIEIDGHNHFEIRNAIQTAQKEILRPSLIIGNTIMGKGCATKENSEDTHGSPLTKEERTATKLKLDLPNIPFYLPEEIKVNFQKNFDCLTKNVKNWTDLKEQKLDSNSEFAKLWEQIILKRGDLQINWPNFEQNTQIATRKAFGACLQSISEQLPLFVGGSADLDPSNQTMNFRKTTGIFNAHTNPLGRNLCFGVREFPMGAIINGIALHGGLIPFGATFLVFSDYERNAIRMSALQQLPVLHVFTHDSFFVGEDGPTHQPIEHVSSLRLIPNLNVFRPADANESKHCMDIALHQEKIPSVLIFTRQSLPNLTPANQNEAIFGAYIISKPKTIPEIIIMASGSEVHIALETAALLAPLAVRVISVPCMEIFDMQTENYKNKILPKNIRKRFAIEAGSPDIWYKYIGLDGAVHGINHFGASAPAKILQEKYSFTPEAFACFIKKYL